MSASAWGEKDTRFFHELTPERILDAVERATGQRCTGRAMALNSMENRVYEIEIELPEPDEEAGGAPPVPRNAAERFLIAKFYRPGRWSQAQILDEHRFLADLAESEIPVVAPLRLVDGATLHKLAHAEIWFSVFPKVGGRSPDELGDEQLARVGRLLARLHGVGAAGAAPTRVKFDPATYGLANLRHLVDAGILPLEQRSAYQQIVESICDISAPWFAEAEVQRIHGDCHLGNLLSGREGLFFVDFDDMVRGPCVQDLWLLVPGRDEYAQRQLDVMLEAYETMRPFDRRHLRLIEPLRALRFVHFSAWIGRRWQDPAFPRSFPQFGTARYWQEQLADLREQQALISEIASGGSSSYDDGM